MGSVSVETSANALKEWNDYCLSCVDLLSALMFIYTINIFLRLIYLASSKWHFPFFVAF